VGAQWWIVFQLRLDSRSLASFASQLQDASYWYFCSSASASASASGSGSGTACKIHLPRLTAQIRSFPVGHLTEPSLSSLTCAACGPLLARPGSESR
jgi:hypothetical protein